jgi:hypothetical protein
VALREEQIIVEEKKAQTDELIVSIGKEKAVVDEAVEAGREDEEAASRLQNEVQAFQEECTKDLAAGGCGRLLECGQHGISFAASCNAAQCFACLQYKHACTQVGMLPHEL